MECACTVEVDFDHNEDEFRRGSVTEITALVQHKCNECYSTINVGDWYFRETLLSSYSGAEVHKTCEHCYSLRQVFFSSGWYYGMLWEQVEEFVHECDGDLSVDCILRLTKVARDKVLDMIEKVWYWEEEQFGE